MVENNADDVDIICKIENDKLILDVSIDIDLFSKHFNKKEIITNNLTPSIELLHTISMIKNRNNLINIIKLFDYYLIKEEFAKDFFKSKDIIYNIKLYYDIDDCFHVQKYLKNIIIDSLNNLNFENKLNIIIKYNVQFYISTLNKYLENITCTTNIINYYVNILYNIIKNKKLHKDHIILDINLYYNYNVLCKIYNLIYNKPYYKDILNLFIENKKFIIIEIISNLDNYYDFKYIYSLYKNEFKNLLYLYKEYIDNYNKYKIKTKKTTFKYLNINNGLLAFIIKDFFKSEILNEYINGYYFNINVIDFINSVIYDDNISEYIVQQIILTKTPHNILLLDLYQFFKNTIYDNDNTRYKNVKSFVYEEYKKLNYTCENLI